MLHTHTLVVSLFLLFILVKFGMLVAGKTDTLENFSKKTKLVDPILGTLMLGTGIFLMVRSPNGTEPFVLVKLGLALGSIPLGIIGLRKAKVGLAGLSVAFLVLAMVLALAKPAFLRTAPAAPEVKQDQFAGEDFKQYKLGKELYYKKICNTCHGDDGAAGFQGAKNLEDSEMTDAEIHEIIRNGKGMMQPNPGISDEDLAALTAYVKGFRK